MAKKKTTKKASRKTQKKVADAVTPVAAPIPAPPPTPEALPQIPGPDVEQFDIGTKFSINGLLYIVCDAFSVSGDKLRELIDYGGTHHVWTLRSLLQERKSKEFRFEECSLGETALYADKRRDRAADPNSRF